MLEPWWQLSVVGGSFFLLAKHRETSRMLQPRQPDVGRRAIFFTSPSRASSLLGYPCVVPALFPSLRCSLPCFGLAYCHSYKIHYPGWADEWDEWVTRDRLRWPVDNSYLSTNFKARDYVEVWCTGTHVKGAWLQARVRQVGVMRSLSLYMQVVCSQLLSLLLCDLRCYQ